ncbi:hypothetical protein MCAMS1_00635 [biofilm metagenome]
MQAILVHGMGRTPLSMYLLAYRLIAAGIKPTLFAYCVTIENWAGCTKRLGQFIEAHAGEAPYVIVTHSLGSVLTRQVLPSLSCKPVACFFLAPPTQACDAARRLAPKWWYRALTGEMGQLLANQEFMSSLPIPGMLTKVYAGTAGLTGRYSPFGEDANDGILMVKETQLPSAVMQTVPSLHTFIMNNSNLIGDIIKEIVTLTRP